MSAAVGVPPPTQRRWQRQGHGMRGGLWWSSLQLMSLLEQSGSGRLQMWKGPGGLRARPHPSQHTPRVGGKMKGGVVAAGLNTSLRWERREMVARLRTYCVSFCEEKIGNVGAVNDWGVICVVHLRAHTWLCFKKDRMRAVKKSESFVSYLNNKIALYLLYSGTAYVRTDDKNVTMLHHAGGLPTFTFVPVIKSFPS